MHALVEKPSDEDVERLRDEHGEVWVSMNVLRLPHEALLAGCTSAPIHPERQERELPTAALLAAERIGAKLQWIPCRRRFFGLDPPQDWKALREGRSQLLAQNPRTKHHDEVEICASTIRDVAVAMEAGAGRVELCSVWSVGGITPNVVAVEAAASMGMPVRALMRPREGSFVHSTWSALGRQRRPK